MKKKGGNNFKVTMFGQDVKREKLKTNEVLTH